MTDVTVRAYELEDGGTSKVPGAYVAALSRGFGWSTDYLLGLSDEPKRPPNLEAAQRAIMRIRDVLEEELAIPAESVELVRSEPPSALDAAKAAERDRRRRPEGRAERKRRPS